MRGDLEYAPEPNPYYLGCRKTNLTLRAYRDVNNLRSYYKRDVPLLYLKPLKITQAHDNPTVLLIHDLMDKGMMKRLKGNTFPSRGFFSLGSLWTYPSVELLQ